MTQKIFTDKKGNELIITSRKSAVFFQRVADINKVNCYGANHNKYVCITELKRKYFFSDETFEEFLNYCIAISDESWSNFIPKPADSWSSEYDDYYDKEFDNNGSLDIGRNVIRIEGPYTQLKSNGELVRLIKFNKRKFESFVYDLLNKTVSNSVA